MILDYVEEAELKGIIRRLEPVILALSDHHVTVQPYHVEQLREVRQQLLLWQQAADVRASLPRPESRR